MQTFHSEFQRFSTQLAPLPTTQDCVGVLQPNDAQKAVTQKNIYETDIEAVARSSHEKARKELLEVNSDYAKEKAAEMGESWPRSVAN